MIRGKWKNPHLKKLLLISRYQDVSNRDEKWLDKKLQEIFLTNPTSKSGSYKLADGSKRENISMVTVNRD
jgi:hypothetical protein